MNAKQRLTALLAVAICTPALAVDSFDSDGDGLDDNEDNCTLVVNPDQADSDLDGFGDICDGDFNNDRMVDFVDLNILKFNFFRTGESPTDLNNDQVTDFADLNLVKLAFFRRPGPTARDEMQPPCDCYFSGDCPGGARCDWGADFMIEDTCAWRDPKPTAFGNGCSTEVEPEEWYALCDGTCQVASAGSVFGREDPELLAQSVELWSRAMLEPAAEGGGQVDAGLAGAARAVQFRNERIGDMLGRHTADLLAFVSDEGFADHFCHYEGHPGEEGPVVNLAGDACAREAARIGTAALVNEIRAPGSGLALLAAIPEQCADWQTRFSARCGTGPGVMACVAQEIAATAYYLRTPRIRAAAPLAERLGLR